MKLFVAMGTIGLLATVAAPALAVQLVTNGGFETGTFSGWTQFGSPGQTNVNAANAITGGFGARFSPNNLGGIFQAIPTTNGQHYVFGFDLRHLANLRAPNNSFSASFDGVTVLSLSNLATTGPTSYLFNTVATGPSSIIRFTFRDNRDPPANRYSLDNVGLRAIGGPGGVPEPESWALLVTGFLLTGLGLRRRRLHRSIVA
jgi:hypothetical protein